MTVVAVRHLPTAWSLAGRLQGRADLPVAAAAELPPEFAQIIRDGRERLAALAPFDRVYCSSLRRTHDTAAAFGYPDPIASPLLDELDFGPFEGRPRADLLAAVGDAWREAPQTLTLGEPVAALAERIRAFIAGPCRGCERVAVFGHGAWLRALMALAETGGIATMNRRELGLGRVAVATIDQRRDAAVIG